MHPNLALGTALAVAAAAYVFKPKKPKTELEANSTPVPVTPSYLPLQLDSVFGYIFSTLAGKDEMEYLRNLVGKLGNAVNMRAFNEDYIVVLDPSSVQHILAKNQPNYEKGPDFQAVFHEFLGSGIFNADGETWKTQRQLARPHFQTNEFKDSALINRHVDQLLQAIDRHIATHANEPLDVQNLFCRFTLGETTEFLFGETVNALEHEDSEFSKAFNYSQAITAWRFRVPIWKYVLPKKRFLQEIKILDAFVYRIIDNAMARQAGKTRQNNNDEPGKDHDRHATLLDHFLSYQKENDFVDRKYLRDMLLNFLLAGRDTHPDVAAKLKQEIMQVLGPDSIPGYDDIKKLKQSVEEDVLPNGYYIPPKTPVAYSAYITHRLPELWGEDALEFNPDRWGPERVSSIKPFMFVPFHAGPRICLGQNLAYTTAQLTLTRILQSYEIQPSSGFQPEQFGDIVLFSRNGVEVRIKKKSLSEGI
ncbi:hypothetical protein BGX28_001585 [Mortierella sp. GBA30]|nr:hypothetical protein BGX28_001585 [Mortierella sp. GBA30]